MTPFEPKLKSELLSTLNNFNPNQYATTRNFIDGDVSRLSPYISRGIISTQEIGNYLSNLNWRKSELFKFLQELAWRDYFQIVYAFKSDNKKVASQATFNIPNILLKANSGIQGIDDGINSLIENGYVHNHQRMYLAMLICNILKIDFHDASRWLYFYLLDADEASNSLSWEWVAGKLTGKKYVANQENINRYCKTNQTKTFLDVDYEMLNEIEFSADFKSTTNLNLQTILPSSNNIIEDETGHLAIFNFYNLDAEWCNNVDCTKILLLEPSHFIQFSICQRSLDFMLAQAKLIEGIEIFVGEFADLKKIFPSHQFRFKSHSLFTHYAGTAEQPKSLFDEVRDYYPSFSAYWKKCSKYL